jgi:SAM-dependent methyltransferase
VTVDEAYFDGRYAASPDPWGFESRWYERRKYAITMALLPAERYRAGFEPGCSIGVLTGLLAGRCDRLLACDGAATAAQAAARRNASHRNVRVERRLLPGDWPAGRFDLIVLSELLYYFGEDDLRDVLRLAEGALLPGGTLIAVHWRHPVAEYPRSGDEAHAAIGRQPGLARLTACDDPDFLAEVYLRADGPPASVAQAAGLACGPPSSVRPESPRVRR